MQNKGETNLDRDNLPINKPSNSERSKRVRRMKRYIICTVILLLILPSILCFIMFFRMISMQNELDVLKQYYSTIHTSSSNISSDNNIIEIVQGYKTYSIDENVNYIDKFNIDTYTLADSVSAMMKGNALSTDASSMKESKATNQESKATTQEDQSTTQDYKVTSKENIDSAKDKKATVNKDTKASKKVYITFDDGPSKYTAEILDLLAEYNVKATFFVIGKTDNESKELYKRIIKEGHSLGMHSYSHNYKVIYNSLKDFEKDFKKIRKLLYDTTGQKINIYRFPGGSGNTVSKEDVSIFIDYLNKNEVIYYDWNVISGDATGKKLTSQTMYQNVMDGVKANKTSIVLMHDTDSKKYTIETLNKILEDLINEGIDVLPLDENVSPMHQVTGG